MNNREGKRTPRAKSHAKRRTAVMPTISYEDYIQARAAAHAAKVNDEDSIHNATRRSA
jgi:hypothetical protein